jgi:hypothetical protein
MGQHWMLILLMPYAPSVFEICSLSSSYARVFSGVSICFCFCICPMSTTRVVVYVAGVWLSPVCSVSRGRGCDGEGGESPKPHGKFHKK